ncbi:unnamed protein product, partial [Hapterophycus canaliculatus]
KNKLNTQTVTLNAKTDELEKSRQEARALAATLGARTEKSSSGDEIKRGPVTVDELLEMGRVKLANHDLALEMASLSETLEILASEKQELEGQLFKKAAEVETCHAETARILGDLKLEREAADGHCVDVSKANASTR